MEHQSVFYLSHNLMYKNNKTISDVKKLDSNLIPKELNSLSNQQIYNYINNDYIKKSTKYYYNTTGTTSNTKLQIPLSSTLAYKILYVAYRLRIAFEGRIRRKDICNLKIPYVPLLGTNILSPDQQFNEYLYIFNKYSNIKVKNQKNYYSKFKQIYDITLTVMKNYE